MAHITVELHENYPSEHIAEREHAIVREEMARIGFSNTALTDGVDRHLPRGCYFGVTGAHDDVRGVWQSLERRLLRSVSLEFSSGQSYGFGLKAESRLGDLITSLSPVSNTEALSYRNLAGLGTIPTSAPRTLLSGLLR